MLLLLLLPVVFFGISGKVSRDDEPEGASGTRSLLPYDIVAWGGGLFFLGGYRWGGDSLLKAANSF